LDSGVFKETYRDPGSSNLLWNSLPAGESELYAWQAGSSYIQEPDYFSGMDTTSGAAAPILGARCLVRAGDSVTTDHISPAGDIDKESPAGRYLLSLGIAAADFNSYGSRRGNDRVMVRGTFANLRFRNLLYPGKTGSRTVHHPSGREMDIHSAAEEYRKSGTPLIILAGKDYGMGSSRDWAAKGPYLLGVKAVIAESYERIHRSNLVGMGILPLQFAPGTDCDSLGLRGTETFSIALDGSLKPGGVLRVAAVGGDGRETVFQAICRIDNPAEMEYYLGGGILRRVVRKSLE
jgi:aconitate hydratase